MVALFYFGDMMTEYDRGPRATIMPAMQHSLTELAKLGTEIFERHVRPHLRPEDHGKFIAIDVESDEYEIDDDDFAAISRLRGRKPTAEVWLMREGFPAAYRIGVGR